MGDVIAFTPRLKEHGTITSTPYRQNDPQAIDDMHFIGSLTQDRGPFDERMDVYFGLDGTIIIFSDQTGSSSMNYAAAKVTPESSRWNHAAKLIAENMEFPNIC